MKFHWISLLLNAAKAALVAFASVVMNALITMYPPDDLFEQEGFRG